MHAGHRRAASAAERGAAERVRQASEQGGDARDVAALLAFRITATHQHVFEQRRIDAAAIDQRAQHDGRHVVRARVDQAAFA
jgi:hypothetical protein